MYNFQFLEFIQFLVKTEKITLRLKAIMYIFQKPLHH